VRCPNCDFAVLPGSTTCPRCQSPIDTSRLAAATPSRTTPPPAAPTPHVVEAPEASQLGSGSDDTIPGFGPSDANGSRGPQPGLLIGGIAAVAVVAALVLWMITRPNSTPAALPATDPQPQATATVTETAPTDTVTVTATATATETQAPVSSEAPSSAPVGSRVRPASWPTYAYYGPSSYDVCQQNSYPLSIQLASPFSPPADSAEYWTVMSAQAALRSLNYGSPTPITADGQDGPRTTAAVVSFQARKGYVTDGVIGPQTWAGLNSWVHEWQGTCP